MRIEIWSDIACPWCYVGKRHLESALERFDHADEVEVEWRSFELDPSAPAEREGSHVELIAGKYGMSVEQAQEATDRLVAVGEQAGLDLRFDRARTGSTFDAHRLLHHARAQGLGAQLKERLMAAYLTEGVLMSDVHELQRLGVEVGLDADECAAVLSGDTYADDVREEERAAADLGANGVPFFVLDRRFAMSGAQPVDTMLEVLEKTWAVSHPTLTTVGAAPGAGEAPGCEGDSCAL